MLMHLSCRRLLPPRRSRRFFDDLLFLVPILPALSGWISVHVLFIIRVANIFFSHSDKDVGSHNFIFIKIRLHLNTYLCYKQKIRTNKKSRYY